MSSVPDIPGEVISQPDHARWLRQQVARLCGLDNDRFPGSQPVSFGTKDIEKLETQDFWVCEKSDGVRVLLYIQTNLQTKEQDVFLIDRHNIYRHLQGLFFPHHENPLNPLRSTIVDGELVVDTDPHTKHETLRFLAFDCLVVDDQNVMSKSLEKRYGRLQEWFYKPYQKMLADHPHTAQTLPFQVKVKAVKPSYHVEDVFARDIPALQHGNDGLVYTSVNTPYMAGTDPNILKWKPPTENSIDFKLVLRFPSTPKKPKEPDYYCKPIFELHVWCGGKQPLAKYEFYDVMYVSDEEWEEMKKSGEQLDDRIVEVHWDPTVEGWRMMRFRTDKPEGNFKTVVENIIRSIADGVEKDQLLAHSNTIRTNWKTRSMHLAGQRPPAPPHNLAKKPPLPPPYGPGPHSRPSSSAGRQIMIPDAKPRYGPLATSPWSKVSGPAIVHGMYR